MEGIGGCRLVLATQAEAENIRKRILEEWQDAHVDDYVARPKDTGCRAVHIVVVEQGRMIEIQLRTENRTNGPML
jgi:putative GTP pyrophosphokinase